MARICTEMKLLSVKTILNAELPSNVGSSPYLPVGVIIGCAVGGVVVLAILLIVTAATIVFVVKRWKKGNHNLAQCHNDHVYIIPTLVLILYSVTKLPYIAGNFCQYYFGGLFTKFN